MRQMSSFQIIVTLPAIWPHYAQLRMREAIDDAGILDTKSAGKPTLSFTSEPEAAALASLEDLMGRVELNVSFWPADSTVLVVDLTRKAITSSFATLGVAR